LLPIQVFEIPGGAVNMQTKYYSNFFSKLDEDGDFEEQK